MSNVYLKIETSAEALPTYMTAGAAAADVFLPETVEIQPHKTIKIPLNLSFHIPEGYCIKMYPRSSLLTNFNLIQPVSIIDSDYTGIVHAPIHNLSDKPIHLDKGVRICQIMIEKVIRCKDWTELEIPRGQQGFGSTGK